MATKTVMMCDGCGKEMGEIAAVRIRPVGGSAFQQHAWNQGVAVELPTLAITGPAGQARTFARLDYCSAECAAKHLGSL